MHTSILKSLAILASVASIFALSVAFTARPLEAVVEYNEDNKPSGSIQQWVTQQLGYPKSLERSEQLVPVIIHLYVAADGKVQLEACEGGDEELQAYIKEHLDGERASLTSAYLNRDFEIKINFRPMSTH
jgi:hypothetical protein